MWAVEDDKYMSLIKLSLYLVFFQNSTHINGRIMCMVASNGGLTISLLRVWGYVVLTRTTMQKRKGKQGVAVA